MSRLHAYRTTSDMDGPPELEPLMQSGESVPSSCLPSEADASTHNEDMVSREKAPLPPLKHDPRLRDRWLALLGLAFFAASLVIFYLSFQYSDAQCTRRLSTYSPAIDGVEYQDIVFKGSLHDHSVFQGPPSLEIDAAWDKISDLRPIRMTEEDLAKIGRKPRPSLVKYHEEFGGGYVATLEIAHYMHCLNMLRKRTYWDHYGPLDDTYQRDPDFYRLHLDHCIDLLRQTLMCSADVGLITFDWVAEKHNPWPNFSTQHRCRNFDKVVGWNEAHAVTIAPANLTRTKDAVDLPEGP